MSFNKKLKEIALYIGSEYSDLELNNISNSHMCVVDICKNVFKKQMIINLNEILYII